MSKDTHTQNTKPFNGPSYWKHNSIFLTGFPFQSKTKRTNERTTTTLPYPGTHRGQGVWQSDDLARIASLFLTLHLALCEKVETHGDGVGILEAWHFAKGNRDEACWESQEKYRGRKGGGGEGSTRVELRNPTRLTYIAAYFFCWSWTFFFGDPGDSVTVTKLDPSSYVGGHPQPQPLKKKVTWVNSPYPKKGHLTAELPGHHTH